MFPPTPGSQVHENASSPHNPANGCKPDGCQVSAAGELFLQSVATDHNAAGRILGRNFSENAFLLWVGGQKESYKDTKGRTKFTEARYVRDWPGSAWHSFAINWSRDRYITGCHPNQLAKQKSKYLASAYEYADLAVQQIATWLRRPGANKHLVIACRQGANRQLKARRSTTVCLG